MADPVGTNSLSPTGPLLASGPFTVGATSITVALPPGYKYYKFDVFDVALQTTADYVDWQWSSNNGATFDSGANYQTVINEFAQPGFIQVPGGAGQQAFFVKALAGHNNTGPVTFAGISAGDKVVSVTNLTTPGDATANFETTISTTGQILQNSTTNLSTSQFLFTVQTAPGNLVNSQQNFTQGSILFVRPGQTFSGSYTITPASNTKIFGVGNTQYANGYGQTQLISSQYQGTTTTCNAIKLISDGAELYAGGSWRLYGYI